MKSIGILLALVLASLPLAAQSLRPMLRHRRH